MQKVEFKNAIIKLLTRKGNFESVDESHIDGLIFWLEELEKAKKALDERNQIETTQWGRKITPELEACQRIQNEVRHSWGILGLTPRDRLKLKLEVIEKSSSDEEVSQYKTMFG